MTIHMQVKRKPYAGCDVDAVLTSINAGTNIKEEVRFASCSCPYVRGEMGGTDLHQC